MVPSHRRALRARLLSFRYEDGLCFKSSPRRVWEWLGTKSWPGGPRPTLPSWWSCSKWRLAASGGHLGDWRVSPWPLPGNLDPVPSLLKLLDPNEREVKRHLGVAAAITSLEPELMALDDAALSERSDELRRRAQAGEDLAELLIEAFALCREAGRRTIGLRHFDVQLVGGIVLHQGRIAEMKTGEGPSPVFISAIRPWCRTMPPTSWTSKWRSPMVRRPASRQSANASISSSSRSSPAWARRRSSSDRSRRAASSRAISSGSRELMALDDAALRE